MRSSHLSVEAVLRSILRTTGWTQKKLAEELDTTQGTVSKLLSEKHQPDFKTWQSVDRLLERLEGKGFTITALGKAPTIPVVGKVGAGSQVFLLDTDTIGDGIDEVEAPPMYDDKTKALIVEGDSQYPRYMNGEAVYYKYPPDRSPGDYLGEECVVELFSGEMLLKTLRRGAQPDTFNLESWNAPPLENQRVRWASPIDWAKRSATRRRDLD